MQIGDTFHFNQYTPEQVKRLLFHGMQLVYSNDYLFFYDYSNAMPSAPYRYTTHSELEVPAIVSSTNTSSLTSVLRDWCRPNQLVLAKVHRLPHLPIYRRR